MKANGTIEGQFTVKQLCPTTGLHGRLAGDKGIYQQLALEQ